MTLSVLPPETIANASWDYADRSCLTEMSARKALSAYMANKFPGTDYKIKRLTCMADGKRARTLVAVPAA